MNKEILLFCSGMSLGRRGFIQDTQYMQDLLNTQHYSFGFPDIKKGRKMFSSAWRLPEGSMLKSKGICHHKWWNPTRQEWGLAWQNICLCQHHVKWNKAPPDTDLGELTSALPPPPPHWQLSTLAKHGCFSLTPLKNWKAQCNVAPRQLCLGISHQKHVQCYKCFNLPRCK